MWEIWWSYCQDIRKKWPSFICSFFVMIVHEYTPKQKPVRNILNKCIPQYLESKIHKHILDLKNCIRSPNLQRYKCTVWKIHSFSITQILREINFEDSRRTKSAIVTHFRGYEFWFLYIFALWKAKIYQIYKIRSLRNSECGKMADFARVESPKLISRKIWVIEKSWNFHTVQL